MKPWINAFLIAFLLAIITRNFIIEPYYVNSKVLEPEFHENELIWLNKLKFGGRFPITPISIPFIHSKIPFTNSKSYSSVFEIPYFRFFGFSTIKKDDFIAFNNPLQIKLPIDRRKILMRKCFATAGDTIEIQTNKVFINGKRKFKLNSNKKTRIWLSPKDSAKAKELNLKINNLGNFIGGFLVDSDATLLIETKKDSSIKVFNLNNKIEEIRTVEKNKFFKGNGFIVPKKNRKIQVNSRNFSYLKPIIEKYEKDEILIKKGILFINGIKTRDYIFKQNYYFVIMNFDDEKKPLKWLLVPENHVISLVN